MESQHSSSTSLSNTPITSPNIQSLVTIKLSTDNNLLWKAQITPHLRGGRLLNMSMGVAVNSPSLILNPEVTQWFNQDLIILSVLMSSLSETILAKGSITISDYFQTVKSLDDTLSAIGNPLPDAEIVSYMLGDLDSNYDPIVTSIQTRDIPMELQDIFGHLLIRVAIAAAYSSY
ncbi:hypothetical protein POM88_053812 [Heracleum sosnowskyi]|uniref:Uncharacterized protein n=1 Tax=Heracleum sosnowskyi TaxID=360622 RepID=A0AAD8LXK0_9APIA|nr:hypothetical protein POM88_053812 [Heracleum sosnowskyi]